MVEPCQVYPPPPPLPVLVCWHVPGSLIVEILPLVVQDLQYDMFLINIFSVPLFVKRSLLILFKFS